MTSCADQIGHENCNFIVQEIVWQGKKADKEAWTRSKNRAFKKKMAAQRKSKI